MPTIQIRNVPQRLYEKLKSSAVLSRRSLTQETLYLLERQLKMSEKDHQEKKLLLWEESKKINNPLDMDIDEVVRWIREDRER